MTPDTFKMTDAESRIQDATVAILRRHCDEIDARLRVMATNALELSVERLCPCGITLIECRCPLQKLKVDRD